MTTATTRLLLGMIVCLVLAGALVVSLVRHFSPGETPVGAQTPALTFPLTIICAKAVLNDYGLLCVKTEPGGPRLRLAAVSGTWERMCVPYQPVSIAPRD
jgi:hypothetical protein